MLGENEAVKLVDWSRPTKELRDRVKALEGKIAVAA